MCLGVLNRIAEIYGWPDFIVERDVADIGTDVLDRYVGDYEFTVGLRVTLTREDGALVVTAPMFVGGHLYPESETRFFYTDLDGEATFTADGKGGMGVTVQIGSVRLDGVRR